MDVKHLKLKACVWCEEEDTGNLCIGVCGFDNTPEVNGYFIECTKCDATTISYDSDIEAAKHWNNGDTWGYDI